MTRGDGIERWIGAVFPQEAVDGGDHILKRVPALSAALS